MQTSVEIDCPHLGFVGTAKIWQKTSQLYEGGGLSFLCRIDDQSFVSYQGNN